MKPPAGNSPASRWNNKFKKKWTEDHASIKSSRRGDTYAFCEVCRADFTVSHGGYNDVKRHLNTEKHKANARAVENTSKVAFLPSKKTIGVTNTEVLVQGMIMEHNLPLAWNDHFTKLAPRLFPDSDIARQYACGRTKGTHVSMEIAGDSVRKIKETVGSNDLMYALATDGSSDEEDKFFPILITHEDPNTGLIKTSFLDMPVVNSATGVNIADAIKESLKQCKISLEQCIAFSSDNASVMTGKQKGVLGQLRKENKDIYLMGCPCHLSALAAKKGSKALKGFDPEDFVIDLYYHFEKSAKRKHELRDMLVFCDVSVRKVLKHVSTRWLSLHKTLERSLYLWDGLRSYFLTYYDDDGEEYESPDNGKEPRKRKRKSTSANKGGPKERRIVKVLKEPTYKLYILFLHAVLPYFDSFNTLLQSEAPMIHQLHGSMMKLYKDLLSCLVLPSVVENETDILGINFLDKEKQRADKDLFVGYRTLKWIEDEDLEGTSGTTRFLSEARNFFINCLNYMQEKFPLRDPLLEAAGVINPACRQSSSMQSLFALVDCLPNTALPEVDKDILCREFSSYQVDSGLPIMQPGDRVDQYWASVGRMTDPGTGSLCYPVLSRLAKTVLLIPHSNSYCESLFSMVKKITTDQRSSLGRSKEGCAKDSAYVDKHGIRNTLCALLAGKINIFKEKTCYTWTPSQDLLLRAKSATYKSLK